MLEWLKRIVLKTIVPQGTVGSNPTLSANKNTPVIGVFLLGLRYNKLNHEQ